MSYSNTAAKVRIAKRTYPHEYCAHFNCLWRTRHGHGRDARVTPCAKHANSVLAFPPAVNPAHVTVSGSPFHVTGIEYPPECCQGCGAPFNDANPSASGLCPICEG